MYQELARFVDIITVARPDDTSVALLWEGIDLNRLDPVYRQMFDLIQLHFLHTLPKYVQVIIIFRKHIQLGHKFCRKYSFEFNLKLLLLFLV